MEVSTKRWLCGGICRYCNDTCQFAGYVGEDEEENNGCGCQNGSAYTRSGCGCQSGSAYARSGCGCQNGSAYARSGCGCQNGSAYARSGCGC